MQTLSSSEEGDSPRVPPNLLPAAPGGVGTRIPRASRGAWQSADARYASVETDIWIPVLGIPSIVLSLGFSLSVKRTKVIHLPPEKELTTHALMSMAGQLFARRQEALSRVERVPQRWPHRGTERAGLRGRLWLKSPNTPSWMWGFRQVTYPDSLCLIFFTCKHVR